ncbi:MAG: ABC transporter permease subunit [Clostridium sp.]|nr:MAG: ABC transporter permease subunit [Clostridium sp.]
MKKLIEASTDLGASKGQTFRRVIMPLSIPGVLSGVTIVFLSAATTIVISKYMGDGKFVLIGNIIETEFITNSAWGNGSAISMILLVIILLILWLTNKATKKRLEVRHNEKNLIQRFILKILMILFFIIYYAPIVSMVIFSFNKERSLTTWYGFSFAWYNELFTNSAIIKVVFWTILIAVCSTVISVIIATFASIALCKTKKNWRKLILQVNNLPITNPDIVTALGLLLLFVSFRISRGYFTMLLAHISFCTPYAIVNIYPKKLKL